MTPPEHTPEHAGHLGPMLGATQEPAKGHSGLRDVSVTARLYEELGDMAKHLSGTLKDLQSAGGQMRNASNELPEVANQLLDLSRYTEEMTHRVLGYTEEAIHHQELITAQVGCAKLLLAPDVQDRVRMGRYLDEISSLAEDDKKVLMSLLAALEFQDLTGQRLRKVEAALRDMQSRILKLIILFGGDSEQETGTSEKQEVLLHELEVSSKSETLNQQLADDILKEFGF